MHADPELLALLALGEHAGTEHERRHARSCPACASEVAELHRVATLGRGAGAETALSTPGRDVWARIRDELGLGPVVDGSGDELTAHARLTPVGPVWSDASGQAELATDDRGRRILQVALQAQLPASGVRLAWLVHRDDPGVRQVLGILDGSHGLWTVDHSIDLQEYPILDISQQNPGEVAHSGQTIVRGEFALAG